MDTLFAKFLKISPWITIVLPSVVVIAVCFVQLAFIKLVIPAVLAFLFVLLVYSVFQ
tara:strand:+ start:713 stop:883 length:171 start_codon:yes stop_codon:yes gene_type:complete